MTHCTLLRVKQQKKLKADAKGSVQAECDFGVVMDFVNENNPVPNENGVLSGNGDFLILQRRFLDFATAIS